MRLTGVGPMSTVSLGAAVAVHGGTLTAVSLGLAGVILSRIVFVDRENRKLGRRQTFRETIPLTLVAMLITGVIVWDNDLGFSKAAFTGLGVGWTAILLLDMIGRRIVDPGAPAPGASVADRPAPSRPSRAASSAQVRSDLRKSFPVDGDAPDDMNDLLGRLD